MLFCFVLCFVGASRRGSGVQCIQHAGDQFQFLLQGCHVPLFVLSGLIDSFGAKSTFRGSVCAHEKRPIVKI